MAMGGAGNPLNTGRVFVTLKPRDQRTANAAQIIARLGPQLDKVEGAKLFLQAAQDVTVGGRASRTQYQYTIQDSDFGELNEWAPKMLAKMQTLPELRDVASDQQTGGTTLTLTFDRDQASRYGLTAQAIDDTLYDAFGQRQIAQYFTQLSSYRVIMEVLPSLQNDLVTLDKIFLKSTTGGEVPLSAFAKWTTTPVQPLSISHQGQFPATTISFNLAPGVALSQATDAVQRAQSELKLPTTISTGFQGNAQAFQASLTVSRSGSSQAQVRRLSTTLCQLWEQRQAVRSCRVSGKRRLSVDSAQLNHFGGLPPGALQPSINIRTPRSVTFRKCPKLICSVSFNRWQNSPVGVGNRSVGFRHGLEGSGGRSLNDRPQQCG
jgi:hypothetical protein